VIPDTETLSSVAQDVVTIPKPVDNDGWPGNVPH